MKHLYLFFTLFFALISCNLFAQSDSTVSFVAYWQKGETQQYKVIKKKLAQRNGKETKNEVNSYLTSFTVLDSTANSYLIEYKYENTLFSSSPELTQQMSSLGDKYRYLTVKYKTNELGAFQGIENWKEVGKMMNDIFSLVIKNTEASKKRELENAMKPLKDVYSSKEGIEGLVFKELQSFHSPYGGVFSITDTIHYEDELPNLIGGDPIKANASLYFKPIDYENGTCTYINELNPDAEGIRKMVTDMTSKIMSAANFGSAAEKKQKMEEMRQAFADMKMDIKDYSTYTYDLENSWPTLVTTKRTTIMELPGDSGKNVEEIIIERVY
ncbi:MAG: hypothetical protein LPK09_06995 [Hymenobacteraceae bacterium]|nr:hypothetical protein [Hymenobacteraceae bacterium]